MRDSTTPIAALWDVPPLIQTKRINARHETNLLENARRARVPRWDERFGIRCRAGAAATYGLLPHRRPGLERCRLSWRRDQDAAHRPSGRRGRTAGGVLCAAGLLADPRGAPDGPLSDAAGAAS